MVSNRQQDKKVDLVYIFLILFNGRGLYIRYQPTSIPQPSSAFFLHLAIALD